MNAWKRLVGAACITLLARGVIAAEPLSANVRPAVSIAPATVRVTVIIEPDDRDRSITVEFDSPAFYRSSMRTLEGEREPRVHEFEFIALPAGSYEVTCRVTRSGGPNPIRRALVRVVGSR